MKNKIKKLFRRQNFIKLLKYLFVSIVSLIIGSIYTKIVDRPNETLVYDTTVSALKAYDGKFETSIPEDPSQPFAYSNTSEFYLTIDKGTLSRMYLSYRQDETKEITTEDFFEAKFEPVPKNIISDNNPLSRKTYAFTEDLIFSSNRAETTKPIYLVSIDKNNNVLIDIMILKCHSKYEAVDYSKNKEAPGARMKLNYQDLRGYQNSLFIKNSELLKINKEEIMKFDDGTEIEIDKEVLAKDIGKIKEIVLTTL